MATTELWVDLRHNSVTPNTGWNISNTVPNAVKQVFANILDSLNNPSGISLWITNPFTERVSNDAWATTDYHGFPMLYWRSDWYGSSGTTPKLELRGFNPGQTGFLYISGHNLSTRNTRYRINGGAAYTYVNSSTLPPNPPIEIPFTATSGGVVEIALELVLIQMFINGFKVVYDPAVAATITSITPLVSGQPFTVTVSDSAYAATQLIVNDGVTTKTVPVTGGSGTFTGTAPALTDGVSMLRVGSTSAKLTNGTLETAGVSVNYSVSYFHPDDPTIVPFTAVRLTSVTSPDTLSAAFALSPPWQIGTDVISDTPERGTFAVDGTFTSSYTGVSYAWYQNPDDRVARLLEVTTDNGEVISVTGSMRPITTEKIEMRAIEMKPITMKPL